MANHPLQKNPTLNRILQVLRDQAWQFVGSLIGALAIFATYHVFFLERDVKALQVVVLADTSLVGVERSVAEEITILYGDQAITNLSLFQVKVENNGTQTIREEDYVRPVEFVFPPQAEIVEAVVLESVPQSIGMTVQKEQNTAILSPVLLNEEDRVIIRMLVSNMPTNGGAQLFNIDARIAGVREVDLVSAIDESSKSASVAPAWWWLGVLLSVLGGFVTAGIVGFVLQELRFRAHRRSQIVVLKTEQAPEVSEAAE
jgi:hypothetical protein